MSDERLRVGIVGLGRRGRHHLEGLSLRDDFRVTVSSDPAGQRVDAPVAATCDFVSHWREVVAGPVDLVLISQRGEPGIEIATAALQAGKGVAFDGCANIDAAAGERLKELARSARIGLVLLNERLWESEFLTAQAAVATGEIGRVQALQHIEWSPPLLGAAACDLAEAPHPAEAWVDQMLRLAGDRPTTVFSPLPGGLTPRESERFFLWIGFAEGATAILEQRRDAAVPHHPGWMLTGATGGYRKGKLYRRLADGEVYDLPFDEVPANPNGVYDDLRARMLRPDVDSFGHVQRVAAVLDAARRSAERGSVEAV